MEKDVVKLFDPPEPGSDWSSDQKNALENMKRCKPPALALFQRGTNGTDENSNVVDPAAQMEEWSEYRGKFKGPKKEGKKQGIVRVLGSRYISLSLYKDDQLNGL